MLTIVVLFIAENPCCMRAQCGLENVGRKARGLESTKGMATVFLHSWTWSAHGKVNPYVRLCNKQPTMPVTEHSGCPVLGPVSFQCGCSWSQASRASLLPSVIQGPRLLPSRLRRFLHVLSVHLADGRQSLEGCSRGFDTTSCGGYMLHFLPHCISQGSVA